ncbi:MAG: SMI1/KNR4 family protein [Ignavibacteriales bacterium]|nr:MAG: SMI1/KNR4 family protein [Ignavibacteriales bacterium]
MDFNYNFGDPISIKDIELYEARLNVKFPEQVKEFYSQINGLSVDSPALEVYNLDKVFVRNGLLYFGRFDNQYEVAFKFDKINMANQWDIVNPQNSYCITHTMASFWSNKIQVWLKNRREVWNEEKY